MEVNLKPLEPSFVERVRVKALFSGEGGDGWCSPCPQLYISDTAFIGYENVKIIRDMCNHALSHGPWDDCNKDKTDPTATDINKETKQG